MLTKIGAGAFGVESDGTEYAELTVYYTGTEEEWNLINIDDGNDRLLNATIYFNYVA